MRSRRLRDVDAAALLPAGREARLRLERRVELDAVAAHARHVARRAHLADEAGRVPRRAAGELALLEQHDVASTPSLREVVGGRAAGDAAADDDDARLCGRRAVHRRATSELRAPRRRRRRSRTGDARCRPKRSLQQHARRSARRTAPTSRATRPPRRPARGSSPRARCRTRRALRTPPSRRDRPAHAHVGEHRPAPSPLPDARARGRAGRRGRSAARRTAAHCRTRARRRRRRACSCAMIAALASAYASAWRREPASSAERVRPIASTPQLMPATPSQRRERHVLAEQAAAQQGDEQRRGAAHQRIGEAEVAVR